MIIRLLLMVFFLSTPVWANDNSDDLFNFSKKQEQVLVVKVVASDLIVLEDGRHIKLIGIESAGPPPRKPVKYDDKGRVIEEPEEPTIPLEEQALTYAQDLLENKKVKLEYDIDAGNTSSGYLNAYVYLPDGRMANLELLRMGFVKLRTIPPNVKYEDKFDAAYRKPKKKNAAWKTNNLALNFEQRVLQFIAKNKLIVPRGRIVIGVSGGADSMALLSLLAALRHDLGVQLHAAHFNHKFRPEAQKDELFVEAWCKKLNIPLTIGRRQGGKIKHLSEDLARQMRFKFFVKTARRLKAQSVALAHTRNDLAETVLMRLMRGSGLYGLRAILPRRSIEGIIFVRPLLDVNRRDLEDYLKTKKVPFRTDTTNHQRVYERNKVRLELLPLLARVYNPRIINALSDLAATAGEDYDFLSIHARKQFEKISFISKRKVKLDLKKIDLQHPAILRLMFRQMVEALTQDPAMLDFEHIYALENLVSQRGPGVVDLPHQLKAVKNQEFLELSLSLKGNPAT